VDSWEWVADSGANLTQNAGSTNSCNNIFVGGAGTTADFELNGQQGETQQQLEMAQIDAITTGRAVAVASTIGVSAIIAPDGAVLVKTKPWTRAELDTRVPLLSALTPADRIGGWPELIITVATAAALLWAVLRRRELRGRLLE